MLLLLVHGFTRHPQRTAARLLVCAPLGRIGTLGRISALAVAPPAFAPVRPLAAALHTRVRTATFATGRGGNTGDGSELAAVRAVTIDSLRALADGEELESARLALERALATAAPKATRVAEPADAEELARIRILLAFALLRLGDSFAAEQQLVVLLGVPLGSAAESGGGSPGSILEPEEGDEDAEAAEQPSRLAPVLGECALSLPSWILSEAQFLLGVAYQRTGREELAVDLLEAVASADEAHWRSRFQLGLIAAQWGMLEDATELLGQVAVLNPSHAQTATILAKLAQLAEARELDAAEEAGLEAEAAREAAELEADPRVPKDAEIEAEMRDIEAEILAEDELNARESADKGGGDAGRR